MITILITHIIDINHINHQIHDDVCDQTMVSLRILIF